MFELIVLGVIVVCLMGSKCPNCSKGWKCKSCWDKGKRR